MTLLLGRQESVEVLRQRRARGAAAFENSSLSPEAKGNAMPTYVTLCNFTHQGGQNIKDTIKRADAFKTAAKKAGCTVKETYWTQGQYDAVTILDAPDDASATALLMSLVKLGNIRTQTLRAFTAAELAPILDKVV
jgi:uncharacterized protein with GYD domain